MNELRLTLASASPRRAGLLAQIGVDFDIMPADIDETPRSCESAETLVARLAETKARAIAADQPDAVVLGADTVVALGNHIFGKPHDKADATRMLQALSGRTHRVCSGLAVVHGDCCETRLCVSQVTFAKLNDAAIADYWASGEPQGKAGAYAIQGLGGMFVRHLEGSYSGVMGLPVHEAAMLLADADVRLAVSPGR